MATDDSSTPAPQNDPTDEELQGLDPAELLARGLNTVRFSGTFGDWAPPAPEELARLLPQYYIESMLGHGGMGAVYKGFQPDLDRPVAIKLLPAELSADEQFVTRFKREARTLARLHHPGIVSVYDFGQTSKGHLYFVMEYIDGTDLRRVLKGPGLSPEQALEVVGQICEALQAAHRQGVIHRDIKPANILLTSDGYVKLADFGLSRPLIEEDTGGITLSHMVMGTADYMSPEQLAGHSDHRTDIYALGVTLYEMLTGRCPRGMFVPPSQRVQVDVRIDEVVIKALQEEPDLRYQQASEMKTDVDHIRTSAITLPEASVPTPPHSLWMRRALAGAALLFLLLAICWAAVVLFKHSGHPAPPNAVSGPAIPANPQSGAGASPNGTSAEQALTSCLWAVATDTDKPMTILYYPDGTARGPQAWTWHWVATGQRTFNLNGNIPCVFDETFSKFIGYSTDAQNRGHTTTGTRLATGVIHFISARYESGAAHRFDVTAKVLATLRTGRRQIPADDDFFGFDPNPGYVKTLYAVLSSDAGQFRIGVRGGETMTIPETLPVALNLPVAPAVTPVAVAEPAKAPSPAPALSVEQNSTGLEQALLGYTWSAQNGWIMNFKSNHIIKVDEGGPPLRTWHWWITGKDTIHIQFAAQPGELNPNIGADLTFDPTFTEYTLINFTDSTKHGAGRRIAPVDQGSVTLNQAPAAAPQGEPAPAPSAALAANPAPTAEPNPNNLEQVLTSSVWTLDGTHELRFYPNGRATSPGLDGGLEWRFDKAAEAVHMDELGEAPQSSQHFDLWFNKDLTGFVWFEHRFNNRGIGSLLATNVAPENAIAATTGAELAPTSWKGALTSYIWGVAWSKADLSSEGWRAPWIKIHPDRFPDLRFYPDGTANLGNGWIPLQWQWNRETGEVSIGGMWVDMHLWLYKDLSGFYWMDYGNGDTGTGFERALAPAPQPVSLVLTSYVWPMDWPKLDPSRQDWMHDWSKLHPDRRPDLRFYPDGTASLGNDWKQLQWHWNMDTGEVSAGGDGVDIHFWTYKDSSGFYWMEYGSGDSGTASRGEPVSDQALQALTSSDWVMYWSNRAPGHQDWMTDWSRLRPDHYPELRFYTDGTADLGNDWMELQWHWNRDTGEVNLSGDAQDIHLWLYKDLSGFYWMEYGTGDTGTASRGEARRPVLGARPTSVKGALLSSWWTIQSDVGESQLQFLPDGTTHGSGQGTWAAAGPQTFTINGKVICVFDPNFNGFIGSFSDASGTHQLSGSRFVPVAQAPTVATSQGPNPAPPVVATGPQMAAPNSAKFYNPLNRGAYDQHYIWSYGNYYYGGRYYPWRYWYNGRYVYSITPPNHTHSLEPTDTGGSQDSNPLDKGAYDQR